MEKLMKIANRMEDKTLFKTEWLSIKRTNDWYDYMHQEKSDGKAVAVLIYRENLNTPICGRFEEVPCHFDGISLCSLTGMVEKEDTFEYTAVKEIYEEAGINCKKEELIGLGTIKNSKASDTITYLYALNAGNRDIGEPIGDGTKGEEGSYCDWVTYKDAIMCKDPLMSTLIKRLEIIGIKL